MYVLRVPYHNDIRIRRTDIQSVRNATGNLHLTLVSIRYKDGSYGQLCTRRIREHRVVPNTWTLSYQTLMGVWFLRRQAYDGQLKASGQTQQSFSRRACRIEVEPRALDQSQG